MKTLTTAATLLLGLLALTGCGSTTETTPSHDEAFIQVLDRRDLVPPVTDGDAMAIDLAHKICNAFDSGATFGMVVGTMAEHNTGGVMSPRDIGWFVGASTSAYCPEHNQ